jgi:branched-chain amino acid transport system substrate-binding protein
MAAAYKEAMMNRREFVAGLTAATALSSVARAETDSVRIGYSIGQTGPFASSTPVQSQAYTLWGEQVNARGGLDIAGVGKKKIEFVVYDDQSQGNKAAQAYERLINTDQVDLLLAPYASPLHLGVLPIIERFKRPLIANTIGTTAARDAHASYMFFTQALPDMWGAEMATVIKTLGSKRVAVSSAQSPFCIEFRKSALPALEKAGLEVVFNQEYATDIKDMTPLLSGIKASNPDFLLAITFLNDCVPMLTQARELGLKVDYFFELLGPAQPSFVSRFGENANGIISLGFWSRHSKTTGSAEFFDGYVKRWNMNPDDKDSSIAYISCQVLEQAVKKAGLDPEKLRTELSSATFDTMMGTVKYNAQNVNIGASPGFIQIQNGINEVVWPPEQASSKIMKKAAWV